MNAELKDISGNIKEMSGITLSMLRSTFKGFMEHDKEILSKVLKDEERINEMERKIAASLLNISKRKPGLKKDILELTNITEHLEEIGDYIKDMIERIELKIDEKLLFSEDALDEYKHLYNAVEADLASCVNALMMEDVDFAKKVLCDEGHVDTLIQKYRVSHNERFLKGICKPFACNMYINLLDFTAQISRHAKAIVKSIITLK